MKVLLTFNESYAPHGAAVITGLLKYASKPISVAILYTEMEPETIQSFRDYYANRLESIEFHKVDVNGSLALKFKNIKSQPHLSGRIEPYLRLFAPIYLNDDEVIYLDCDIVVEDDIYKMLNEVDYNCFVSGVREYDPKHVYEDYSCLDANTKTDPQYYFYKNAFFMRTLKYYKMSSDSSYLCTGIMHLNLKKWREDGLIDMLIKKIDETDLFFCADQDVMNSVIDGKFGVISPRWNTIVKNYGILANYSSEQYQEMKDHPAIVHMPGAYKPWVKGTGGVHVENYWEYRKDTPWPERKELDAGLNGGPLYLRIYHRITGIVLNVVQKFDSFGKVPTNWEPISSIFAKELSEK